MGFGCILVLSDSVPQPYRLCPGTGGFSHGLRNSPTMAKYMGVDKGFVYIFAGGENSGFARSSPREQ